MLLKTVNQKINLAELSTASLWRKIMKTLKTFYLLFAYLIMSQVTCANLSRYEAISPQELPPFSFGNQEGYPTDLGHFKGKIVLLNIWSLGCGPCISEMPSLDRLAGMFPDKDFAVVTVNIDPLKPEAIKSFYDKSKFQYLDIYLDPYGKIKEALNWRALPTTIILNREGKMIGRMIGATSWDSSEAVDLIEALIEGKTPKVSVSLFQQFMDFFNKKPEKH